MLSGSVRAEVAIGDINKFMGVSKSKVPMLGDKFACSCLVLHNTHVVNTGGEFCGNVPVVLAEFGLMVWVGPENGFSVPVISSEPVTLGVDPMSLPWSPTTDCEFLPFTELN